MRGTAAGVGRHVTIYVCIYVYGLLHKPVAVQRRFWEHREEVFALVVVAQQQAVGAAQLAQQGTQSLVRGHVAPVRQVAGEEHMVGVGVVQVDVRNAFAQPL